MFGLRSGRLLTASVHAKSDISSAAETAHSQHTTGPQPVVGVRVKQEPTELPPTPVIQSPYFPQHVGAFGSPVGQPFTMGPPGGGLDETEEFDFDAGYVISSRLSQMVSNGAYSYPSPQNTSFGHVPIPPPLQPDPCLLSVRNHHTIAPSYIKTEPGANTSCHREPTIRIKSEPRTDNIAEVSINCSNVRIKQERGVEQTCTHSLGGPSVMVKQEPDLEAPSATDAGKQSTAQIKTEPSPNKRSKGKRSEVKTEDIEDGWEPLLWRVQYHNICQMRKERTAPVDTHGCFMLAERDVPPHVRRYQVLVSLMLSSQTKDQITGKAMTNLKRHGLTIDNVLVTPREDIAKMINAVGFWQKKSEYIKRTTEILASKYAGDIPGTLQELMSLPGVGPKMANLVMDFAWGQTTGIAVDTHVHRIAHRLGWMRKQTPTPEATRISLEKWLPMSEWSNLNLMMVGFGQTLCAPQRPRCEDCLNRNMCPSSLACNDATMGGLAGHYSPDALTTGKKKKKSKSTPTKGTSKLATPTKEATKEVSTTPVRKKRKLSKDKDS